MAQEKRDPLKGMNPDQSGNPEDIQNGDPHSSPNRDQRSGAAEAGGPNPSLDSAEMGGKHGEVPPHNNLEVVEKDGKADQTIKGKDKGDFKSGDGKTNVKKP